MFFGMLRMHVLFVGPLHEAYKNASFTLDIMACLTERSWSFTAYPSTRGTGTLERMPAFGRLHVMAAFALHALAECMHIPTPLGGGMLKMLQTFLSECILDGFGNLQLSWLRC